MAILTGLRIALWDNHQKPDPTHPSGLLRTRRERPRCRRPAEYRNELAPSHCLPRGSGQGIVPAQTSTLEGVGREVIRCLRWVICVDWVTSAAGPLCPQYSPRKRTSQMGSSVTTGPPASHRTARFASAISYRAAMASAIVDGVANARTITCGSP